MTTTPKSFAEFQKDHPAGLNTSTGLWGWRRVLDCLNLNACGFGSREEAEADRDSHYDHYVREVRAGNEAGLYVA